MKGISKVEVPVVEKVTDGAVLLRDVVVGKLRQKLTKVLPLRIRKHFTPGAPTHHREEDVRLMKKQKGHKLLRKPRCVLYVEVTERRTTHVFKQVLWKV